MAAVAVAATVAATTHMSALAMEVVGLHMVASAAVVPTAVGAHLLVAAPAMSEEVVVVATSATATSPMSAYHPEQGLVVVVVALHMGIATAVAAVVVVVAAEPPQHVLLAMSAAPPGHMTGLAPAALPDEQISSGVQDQREADVKQICGRKVFPSQRLWRADQLAFFRVRPGVQHICMTAQRDCFRQCSEQLSCPYSISYRGGKARNQRVLVSCYTLQSVKQSTAHPAGMPVQLNYSPSLDDAISAKQLCLKLKAQHQPTLGQEHGISIPCIAEISENPFSKLTVVQIDTLHAGDTGSCSQLGVIRCAA